MSALIVAAVHDVQAQLLHALAVGVGAWLVALAVIGLVVLANRTRP